MKQKIRQLKIDVKLFTFNMGWRTRLTHGSSMRKARLPVSCSPIRDTTCGWEM